jgi:uncharacterized membrane protein YgaE (UPF0421/DUF939 family)
VITQSSLGAALIVSWQRFIGTALGAVVAGVVGNFFSPTPLVFGASVFILGVLCALTWSDRSAFRFAGVTLTAVLLIPRSNPAWQVAVHRFAEVSIGIAVALILAVAWPEGESTLSEKSPRARGAWRDAERSRSWRSSPLRSWWRSWRRGDDQT